MSDPLWFLENLEEIESKSDQKDFTFDLTPQRDSGNGKCYFKV